MSLHTSFPRVVTWALAVPALCIAVLWFWAVPGILSTSSFLFAAVLLMGASIVALITWRNAQATGTVGQLLLATESAATPGDAGAATRART